MDKVRLIHRKLKNAFKQFDDAEIRVREATSNDPWGASSDLMQQIADDCNHPLRYQSTLSMIWKRLSDYRHYRHIVKSLHLIEYLLKNANHRFVHEVRIRKSTLKSLEDFKTWIDGQDVGHEVRSKAAAVYNLVSDSELLKTERATAKKLRGKIFGLDWRTDYSNMKGSPQGNSDVSEDEGKNEKINNDLESSFSEEPKKVDKKKKLRNAEKVKVAKAASPEVELGEFDSPKFGEEEPEDESDVEEENKSHVSSEAEVQVPKAVSFQDEDVFGFVKKNNKSRDIDLVTAESVNMFKSDKVLEHYREPCLFDMPQVRERQRSEPLHYNEEPLGPMLSPASQAQRDLTMFDDLFIPAKIIATKTRETERKRNMFNKPTLKQLKDNNPDTSLIGKEGVLLLTWQ